MVELRRWGHALRCPVCGEQREPYSLADEQGRYCRACLNAYKRRWRTDRYSNMSAEQRHRYDARIMAWQALRRGLIKREPCVVCDSPHVQMHHPNYAKPLEVVWFCAEHHRQFHLLQPRRGDADV